MTATDSYSGSLRSAPHGHHHHHHRRRTTGSLSDTSSTGVPTHNFPPSSATVAGGSATPSSSSYNYSTFEMENSKTKYKLDQLRLVMQQKKERREARKLQNAPYNICGTGRVTGGLAAATTSTTTTTITAVASPSNTVPPPASSPSATVESIVEEVDPVA